MSFQQAFFSEINISDRTDMKFGKHTRYDMISRTYKKNTHSRYDKAEKQH